MIGVVIACHGKLAEGFRSAAEMLTGDVAANIKAVGLYPDDSTDSFLEKLRGAVSEADSGSGVVIFTDFYGGTPCNLSRGFMSERVQVVAGTNLPILIEFLLSLDEGEPDLRDMIEEGASAIKLLEPQAVVLSDDDELL